jgi:hypothetical protein
LCTEIEDHLLNLREEISRYFSDISNGLFLVVRRLLTFQSGDKPDIAQDEFIEMINKAVVKLEVSTLTIEFAHLQNMKDCKHSSENPSTLHRYLQYGVELLSLLQIKSKPIGRLTVEEKL